MTLDPVQRLVLANALAAALGLAATAALALWTWRTLPPSLDRETETRSVANLSSGAAQAAVPAPPFDARSFAVTLWNPKPLPQTTTNAGPAATTAAAEAPLNLLLIGVTREQGKLVAALYDTVRDELLLVADGDRIGALTVTKTTLESVALMDGMRVRELRMKRADQ